MSTLERLPVELVEDIVSWIEGDLKSLCLVSRHVNQAARRVLWSTHALVINFGPISLIKTYDGRKHVLDISKFNAVFIMLQELRDRRLNSTCKLIQKLQIKVGPWASLQLAPDSEERKFMGEMVPKLLPGVLFAFQGLLSARVEVITTRDPEWLYESIFRPLASLPLLREFHGRLTRLAFDDRFQHGDDFIPSLAQILAHNPRITHLKLDNYTVIGARNHDFRVLFKEVGVHSLPLTSLYFHGWLVDFSAPEILPHIKQLHTMELVGHHENYPNVWKIMREQNIHPRLIRYHSVTDDLVDFLESFEGLQEFFCPYNGYLETDERASLFYRSTLYGHRCSLREIHIGSIYESTWTIGLQDAGIFDAFEKLVSLSVGVKLEDVKPGLNELDVVASLLMRLSRLPGFRRLNFTKVERKRDRALGCFGTVFSEFEVKMESEIKRALECARIQVTDSPPRPEIRVFTPADVVFDGDYTTKQVLKFKPQRP
ncbi:hypothetical protein PQX77_008437 [Marasmius sp. AFHP31]|nr:hypothetical protein PQX77_008437 [Marasmius sp. AFHP31]